MSALISAVLGLTPQQRELLRPCPNLTNGASRHALRAAWVASLICIGLGTSSTVRARTAFAALTHDVGEFATRLALLGWQSASLGAALLMEMPFRDPTQQLVSVQVALGLHECWDGTGRPLGLRRHQIPLAVRIVAVADAYDHLVAAEDALYAEAVLRALESLRGRSGSAFDPDCVEALAGGIGRLLRDEAGLYRMTG
ncbi:HD domain-containing protein [Rhizobacter sp. AJA081-3]|jgi:hypothetical protein|uniref:HD-GYP domain-containing protein n=1 Tax=Rhizobacter sp. AJA081-3 TaxID=2753607 RepID=UPI001AE0443B|nr:HD domain-containing phosphohydrolase [Rhizobacter sp. AJA081-3]QTN25711.1 HD domain-containing protein [Rhizobacter sp. AJA081-3]